MHSQHVVPLRSIQLTNIGQSVTSRGIVTTVTNPKPAISILVSICKSCGHIYRMHSDSPTLSVPNISIILQELPHQVPFGEVPRRFMILLQDKLIDRVRPGVRVIITGVLKHSNNKVFIKASALDPESADSEMETSPQDIIRFQQLVKEPDFLDQLVNSISPALFGMEDIKLALLLQLFSGCQKTLPDGLTLRGFIHVLLIGDPGCGKSQFLKFINTVAPFSVFSSGQGSSAAGLTASVLRDKQGQFYLEAGALVLADGGVACIDEFDKIPVQDAVSIHEAMEQQTISIAKAGLLAVLNSRTSILAAANPTLGYSLHRMSDTLLSRFDLIFTLKDTPNDERDIRLAKFILKVHTLNPETSAQALTPALTPEQLRLFVLYARRRFSPRITPTSAQALLAYFTRLRQDKPKENITWRQLEALVRLSEATARVHLSNQVDNTHCEIAIQLYSSVHDTLRS